jgi:hypothetical protein
MSAFGANLDATAVKPRRISDAKFGSLEAFIRAGPIFALAVLCYQVFSPFLTLMISALVMALALCPLQQFLARYTSIRKLEETTMRIDTTWLSRAIVVIALGLAFAGAASAQTTTVDTRDFEVISVDGNKLVVRDQRGTHELAVPDDFRFTVDGKKMAVSELKPGMKGTAIVTTTTTIKPVVVTEVREGDVLRASEMSMTVPEANGTVRRFTQGQLDTRGVQMVKDGKPIRVSELKRGDKITATIITDAPPVVLTEQEVQATLAETKAEPPATQMAAVTGAAQPTAPAASAQTPASPPPSAPQPAPPPAEASGMGLTWWVIAVLIAVALFVFLRRRKAP